MTALDTSDDDPFPVVPILLKEFYELPEYSASLPTGVTVGKRWRRWSGSQWFLGEYFDIGEPNRVGIRWSRALILQPLELVPHLRRQRDWSLKTFGPGDRSNGVLDHLLKELAEIEAQPDDLSEWIDVAILAFDGAMRRGFTPEQVAAALLAKQAQNEARTWPDWRTADPDKAIEHDRRAAGGAP